MLVFCVCYGTNALKRLRSRSHLRSDEHVNLSCVPALFLLLALGQSAFCVATELCSGLCFGSLQIESLLLIFVWQAPLLIAAWQWCCLCTVVALSESHPDCLFCLLVLFGVFGSVTPAFLYSFPHLLAAAVALVQRFLTVDGGCRSAACCICHDFDFLYSNFNFSAQLTSPT